MDDMHLLYVNEEYQSTLCGLQKYRYFSGISPLMTRCGLNNVDNKDKGITGMGKIIIDSMVYLENLSQRLQRLRDMHQRAVADIVEVMDMGIELVDMEDIEEVVVEHIDLVKVVVIKAVSVVVQDMVLVKDNMETVVVQHMVVVEDMVVQHMVLVKDHIEVVQDIVVEELVAVMDVEMVVMQDIQVMVVVHMGYGYGRFSYGYGKGGYSRGLTCDSHGYGPTTYGGYGKGYGGYAGYPFMD